MGANVTDREFLDGWAAIEGVDVLRIGANHRFARDGARGGPAR